MELHEVQRPPTRVARYEAPDTLDDAFRLLASNPNARPIAGGTDLLVELDRGHHTNTEMLLDLGRIPGLDQITVHGNSVTIGALVTHNQVVGSGECQRLALPLAQACLEVGSPQLRNRATVVGNVVTASPANDTISALLALGASVQVDSASGRRRVRLVDFITGFRTTDLQPGELVTAISIPSLAPTDGGLVRRGIFVKLGLRRHLGRSHRSHRCP